MSGWSSPILKTIVCTLSILMQYPVQAGVVLTGTRIILAQGQTEKTIYLQNKDTVPALVQVWVDDGDEHSTIETAKSPYVLSPQIFRMEANAGQAVRVRFTAADQVSQDKESLYYLNFLQYPAVKTQDAANNRLMVVFKNRIKVFYRPKNIIGHSADTLEKLDVKFNSQTKQLSVYNPTAYFANIQELRLLTTQKDGFVKHNEMVAPNSTVNWDVKSSDTISANSKVRITLVNDYGTVVIREVSPSS